MIKFKHLNRLLLAAVAAIFLMLPVTARADSGGFTIEDYQVLITLREDNVYEVSETVVCDFYEPRHGLYRSIPEKFTLGKGATSDGESREYACKINNVSVQEDGYSTDSEDGEFVLKIGDPDYTITGPHTYRYSYEYQVYDDRMSDMDFIFYSVLGADWGTEIEHFTFSVNFEKALPQEAVDGLHLYSGHYGVEGNWLDAQLEADTHSVKGEIYNIPAYNAVTIFTKLPQGYFVGTKTFSKAWSIICFALLFIVLIISVILIIKGLTAEHHYVKTVEFYPPDNMCSAYVGMIVDESSDLIDIASLIPWMANQGYISIEVVNLFEGGLFIKDQNTLRLTRHRPVKDNDPECVKSLYNVLFDGRNTVMLSELNEYDGEAIKAVTDVLSSEFQDERELSNGKWEAIGLAFLAALFWFLGMSFSSAVSTFGCWFEAGISILPVLAATYVSIGSSADENASIIKKVARGLFIIICILAGYGLCRLLFEGGLFPTVLISAIYWITAVIIVALRFAIYPTEYKLSIMGKIMGFKDFIVTSEESRLKMLLDENPVYFYDILPYAMVFGLADEWAKKFVNLDVTKPGWCTGDYDTWNTAMFCNSIVHGSNDGIKSSVSAADAANSSSSGGYSGGGGGGGGGGSW